MPRCDHGLDKLPIILKKSGAQKRSSDSLFAAPFITDRSVECNEKMRSRLIGSAIECGVGQGRSLLFSLAISPLWSMIEYEEIIACEAILVSTFLTDRQGNRNDDADIGNRNIESIYWRDICVSHIGRKKIERSYFNRRRSNSLQTQPKLTHDSSHQ